MMVDGWLMGWPCWFEFWLLIFWVFGVFWLFVWGFWLLFGIWLVFVGIFWLLRVEGWLFVVVMLVHRLLLLIVSPEEHFWHLPAIS